MKRPEMTFTRPDGVCLECGVPYWQEEHNHKKLGTLSSEAALQAWEDKLAREQEEAARAEADAAESRK
jgi:hypothetical protein